MSDGFQKNLELVKKTLALMQLKKRTKQQLIDLANSIGTHSLGTKESLIGSLATKITSMLLQDGLDAQRLNVQEIMMTARFRLLNDVCRDFVRQVLKNYKKQQRKGDAGLKSYGETSVHQPLPLPKSMYSFNPTFQNYNFIPLFQNNMNFANPNNFISPMMPGSAIPHLSPMQPAVQALPFYGGLPLTYNYDSLLPSSSMQLPGQPPKLQQLVPMPMMPQLPSSVDPRMFLSNPPLPMLNSSIRTSQSRESSQQLRKTKQTKMEVIENLEKVYELKCICLSVDSLRPTILCHNCNYMFHEKCLNMVDCSDAVKNVFECPTCTLRTMDPLHEVTNILQQDLISFQRLREKTFFISLKLEKYIDKKPNDSYVQLRCVKLDGDAIYEISWPDSALIKLNDDKSFDMRPLQYLSSVKKRKDVALQMDFNSIKKFNNTLTVKIEYRPISKDQLKNYKVKEGSPFMLGVYIVTKVPVENLVKSIVKKKREREECRKFLIERMIKMEDVRIEKLTVSTIDSYKLQPIRIPARGKFCQHAQCFDLNTFLVLMGSNTMPNWLCPICKRRCFSLWVDTYMQAMLEDASRLENCTEITIFSDATYKLEKKPTCIQLDDDEDEDRKQEKTQKENQPRSPNYKP